MPTIESILKFTVPTFKKYGSIIENITIQEGDGLSLHAANNSQPLIQLGKNCHLPEDAINLDECTIDTDKYQLPDDLKAAWEYYLRFVLSQDRVNERKMYLQPLHEIEAELQNNLSNALGFTISPLATDAVLRQSLIDSRTLRSPTGSKHVIPILDFANHDWFAQAHFEWSEGNPLCKFTHGNNGSSELYICYGRQIDSLALFSTFLYPGVQDVSFSMALRFQTPFGDAIRIMRGRKFEPAKNSDYSWDFSRVMLGHKQAPKLPFAIFRKMCEPIDIVDTVSLFSQILYINYNKLDELNEKILDTKDFSNTNIGKDIIKCISNQKRAMQSSWITLKDNVVIPKQYNL